MRTGDAIILSLENIREMIRCAGPSKSQVIMEELDGQEFERRYGKGSGLIIRVTKKANI